jgi:hypothetical protein
MSMAAVDRKERIADDLKDNYHLTEQQACDIYEGSI